MKLSDRQNYLLKGKSGLPMRTDAIHFAASYLNTENPFYHPDFLLIEKPAKKTRLGVEEAAQVIGKAAKRPSIAEKHFIIIDGIDSMTEIAQNKLLKVLEDGENILVIAISYGGTLLDTVISRMAVLEYHSLEKEEFNSRMALSYPSFSADIYYQLTKGCFESVEDLSEYNNMFLELRDCIDKRDFLNMFNIFHLVKEKDTYAVTENRRFIPYLISFLQIQFSEYMIKNQFETVQHGIDIIRMIEEHRLRCERPGYTKDDFLNLIVHILEIGQQMK